MNKLQELMLCNQCQKYAFGLLDDFLGDLKTELIPQEMETLESCLKTMLRVLVSLDPREYEQEEKSDTFIEILSGLDTYIDLDRDIGGYHFSNIISDDEKVMSILENNVDNKQVDLIFLKELLEQYQH